MELAVEIFHSVDDALVFSRAALPAFEVPLNANPDRVSGLGVVQNLSHVSYSSDVLRMLQADIFV